MRTNRKPGKMLKDDIAFWSKYQDKNGLQIDGKVGHQVTGEVKAHIAELESRIAYLLLGDKLSAGEVILIASGVFFALIGIVSTVIYISGLV